MTVARGLEGEGNSVHMWLPPHAHTHPLHASRHIQTFTHTYIPLTNHTHSLTQPPRTCETQPNMRLANMKLDST